MQTNYIHQTVLLQSAIEALNVRVGEWYVDGTLGSAGHTIEILNRGGKVLGVDQDPHAITRAAQRISQACPALVNQKDYILHHGPFSSLETIAEKYGISSCAGVLLDLGISSDQLDESQRGFSFLKSGPLDMRMDPTQSQTAADIVNQFPQRQLEEIFSIYGDEPKAKRMTENIIRTREKKEFRTTDQLAELAIKTYGGQRKIRGIHPATRVFQALRIAVNRELEQLMAVLPQAWKLLSKQGRLAVISFHSGEDRIVKHFFNYQVENQQGSLLENKLIRPTDQELEQNPRARSAKLRAIEKI